MKLYHFPGVCSLASHIALREVGARFDLVTIDIAKGAQRTPDYLAINPKGKVPALETEQGVLTESVAILNYVAALRPDLRLALQDDPWDAAKLLSFNAWLSSTVHSIFAHIAAPSRFGEGEEAARGIRARQPALLVDAFDLIETRLLAGPWVHGQAYTTSDAYLFLLTFWFRRQSPSLGIDYDRYPRLEAHFRRMAERPAVRDAVAAEGIDLFAIVDFAATLKNAYVPPAA